MLKRAVDGEGAVPRAEGGDADGADAVLGAGGTIPIAAAPVTAGTQPAARPPITMAARTRRVTQFSPSRAVPEPRRPRPFI